MYAMIADVKISTMSGIERSSETTLRHSEGEVKMVCLIPEHTERIHELHRAHPDALFAFSDFNANQNGSLWMTRA
jgi:hypothetical protein